MLRSVLEEETTESKRERLEDGKYANSLRVAQQFVAAFAKRLRIAPSEPGKSAVKCRNSGRKFHYCCGQRKT